MTDAAPDLAYYEQHWLQRGEWEPHIAKRLAREDWKSDMIEWQAAEIERLRADLALRSVEPSGLCDKCGASLADPEHSRYCFAQRTT